MCASHQGWFHPSPTTHFTWTLQRYFTHHSRPRTVISESFAEPQLTNPLAHGPEAEAGQHGPPSTAHHPLPHQRLLFPLLPGSVNRINVVVCQMDISGREVSFQSIFARGSRDDDGADPTTDVETVSPGRKGTSVQAVLTLLPGSRPTRPVPAQPSTFSQFQRRACQPARQASTSMGSRTSSLRVRYRGPA